MKINKNRLTKIISESIKKTLEEETERYWYNWPRADRDRMDRFHQRILKNKDIELQCAKLPITNFKARKKSGEKYAFIATFGNGEIILKGIAEELYEGGYDGYIFKCTRMISNGKEGYISLETNDFDSELGGKLADALEEQIGGMGA